MHIYFILFISSPRSAGLAASLQRGACVRRGPTDPVHCRGQPARFLENSPRRRFPGAADCFKRNYNSSSLAMISIAASRLVTEPSMAYFST